MTLVIDPFRSILGGEISEGVYLFDQEGDHSFTVPAFTTMEVHVYGPGAPGVGIVSSSIAAGTQGTLSAFDHGGDDEITALPGGLGTVSAGGIGGTGGTGGDTHEAGGNGGGPGGNYPEGRGGDCKGPDGGGYQAANGGLGDHQGVDGNDYGGGGSGCDSGTKFQSGGGGGEHSTKTFTSPSGPTPGAELTIRVGTRGVPDLGGNPINRGGYGARAAVKIIVT